MRAKPKSAWKRLAMLACLLTFSGVAMAQGAIGTARSEKDSAMKAVTSRDGTRIAYEVQGKGQALIVVGGALSDRSGGSELAELLAAHFTVYSYDRRGRGDSANTQPYAVQREVEDLAALVDAAGGSAFVYGKSSGAALALEAAAVLGDKVKKLALYEAPYSGDKDAAGEWKEFRVRLDKMLASKSNADAVAAFMEFVGAPKEAIAGMKASPAWPGMVAMAPTLAYDTALLGADRAVPVDTAARVKVSTLVMDGAASAGPMPFMRATADTLAKAMPKAQRRTLDGQAHDVSAKAIAPVLKEFFD